MKTAAQHNFGQVGEVTLLTCVKEHRWTLEEMTNLQASEERRAKALSAAGNEPDGAHASPTESGRPTPPATPSRALRFTVLIDPMGAVRQTHADRWKKRDCVLRYAEYKFSLKQKIGEIPVPDEAHCIFHIAMPQSWSAKKRKLMIGQPHRPKPDRDNLEKAVLDALWENDSAVWKGSQEKRWAESGAIELVFIYHP
jgi:Holliday junction resolvase RusA-like endonuclease